MAAQGFSRCSFDWVYIDANQTESHVGDDLRAWWPLVRPGGWLTGDDYGLEGWWGDGVRLAVDEFIKRTPMADVAVIGTQFMLQKPVPEAGEWDQEPPLHSLGDATSSRRPGPDPDSVNGRSFARRA